MRLSRAAVLALSVSSLALSVQANAQSTATPPATPVPGATAQDGVPDEAPEETVIVTGSRAANRTVADSPVPIDVISSESLTAGSGSGEVNTVLNTLVPSFNFPRPSIADGSDVIRPATLRGLAPDQTLVLVNGKRRHVSSLLNINGTVGRGSTAVDLNAIPALAIERIEVLRDGASSQYGSDAIAGVINIQLKRADHGGKASISYGKYSTTMDDVARVTGLQVNGAGQPFYNAADLGAATAYSSAGTLRYLTANTDGSAKRHDGDTWTIGANLGVPIGQGYLNVTGEYRDRDTVNRAGYDLRPNYLVTGGVFDARELTFNRLNFQLGDPKTEDYNVFANAGMPLGNIEFYSFGSYAHRTGLSAANYRQASTAANRDFSVLTPATAPTNANFVAIYPNGFLPFIGSTYEDYSGAAGLKGDFSGFKFDLSGVYGHNLIDYRTLNSINASFGSAGPRNVDSGGLRYGQFVGNLDLTREFDAGLNKPITLALGAEYRHENFKEIPGQLESYAAGPFNRPQINNTTAVNCTAQGGVFAGTTCSFPGRQGAIGQQGFPGIPAISATDASRHSYAGYVEVDADVTDALNVTAAGRYEHFSDFGHTYSGKLAGRVEIIPQFAVRGSISNGFRAPSLQQQFFTTTSTNFINGLPVDTVTAQVSSPVALALGSKPLKAEKSVNISGGVTTNPFRGLNITADYFHIKIRDRVVLTENLGAQGSGTQAQRDAVQAVLNANGQGSVQAARFFINGLDTKTQGVDVVGTYRFGIAGFGNWSLSAAYNYTQNKIDKRLNSLGPLATIPGLVLFGRVEGIRFEDGQPKDKVVLSGDGSFGAFGITARTTRYGKVVGPGAAVPVTNATSLTDYGPDDVFLKAKWITDLELRFTFKDHATFSFGADNVFDVYPTRNPFGPRPAAIGGQYPINQLYIPYSGFSPFGFNGRFLYGRFTTQF